MTYGHLRISLMNSSQIQREHGCNFCPSFSQTTLARSEIQFRLSRGQFSALVVSATNGHADTVITYDRVITYTKLATLPLRLRPTGTPPWTQARHLSLSKTSSRSSFRGRIPLQRVVRTQHVTSLHRTGLSPFRRSDGVFGRDTFREWPFWTYRFFVA